MSLFDCCSNPITPEIIATYQDVFPLKLVIPIYQRLFVWGEEQINQLLNDLWESFVNSTHNSPYYIGIINIVKNKEQKEMWDVIDGQQRLTFLSLFGAYSISCLGQKNGEPWNTFLYIGSKQNEDNLRIHYSGRVDEERELVLISTNDPSRISMKIKTPGFVSFLRSIESFRKKIAQEDFILFSSYVFARASFLVSLLPHEYEPSDLNLFFERMNSSGKQLTPIEQIKGKYFPALASLFDACLDFENKYDVSIRKRMEKKKKELASQSNNTNTMGLPDFLNIESILLDDKISPKNESQSNSIISCRSLLDPEVFLLHSLVIALDYDENYISHDKGKILQTISKYLEKDDLDTPRICRFRLLVNMIRYRRWLDENIIYLGFLNGAYEYRFRKEDESSFREDDKTQLDPVRQFQSMLYVSSDDWQKWVLDAYRYDKDALTLNSLKEREIKPVPNNKYVFSYNSIERYWFWLLDFILWEEVRKQLDEQSNKNCPITLFNIELSDEMKDAIIGYRFRRNRSIEHLHPQTDGLPAEDKWNQSIYYEGLAINKSPKDWFGNLALISSTFNSAQGNDSIGVKFARVKDTQIPQKNLESIKMLLMFLIAGGDDKKWTPELSVEHGKAMCDLLKKYYESNSDTKE